APGRGCLRKTREKRFLNRKNRHARPCAGHPRLKNRSKEKTWMAGTSPAMTASPPSRVFERYPALGFGLRLHLAERDAVGEFDQRHAGVAVLVDGEYREIGDHHVDHPLAGQRQGAFL